MEHTQIIKTIGQLSHHAIKMLLAPATTNGPVDLRVPLNLSGPEQQNAILHAVGDLARHGLLTCSGDVIELTQAGRAVATVVKRDPIAVIHAQFAAADAEGVSSNDVAQMLDDLLTAYGQPTVMCASKSTPAGEGEFLKHTCNDGRGPFFGRLKPKECARCAEREREREQGIPARDPSPRVQASIDKRRRAEQDAAEFERHHAPGGRHQTVCLPQADGLPTTCYEW